MSCETTAVSFIYAPKVLPADLRMPDRPDLFSKLENRDIQPFISVGAEAAFTEAGVEVYQLASTAVLRRAGRLALDDCGLFVNRLNRSVKYDDIAADCEANWPAQLNENAARRLFWRKELNYEEVLSPLKLGIETTLIEDFKDIDSFVDTHAAQCFVAKPRNGNLGKGIAMMRRDAVGGYFKDNPGLLGKRVVQPAYDFTHAFPAVIRPYDNESSHQFEAWNATGKVKELRYYGFVSPEGTTTFPVARALHDGDQWFFVDPDTVPEMLGEQTSQVLELAALKSESKALFGAVDFGYGSLDNADPEWKIIEVNGLAPYLLGRDKHAGIADHLRDLLADQIRATIDYSKR